MVHVKTPNQPEIPDVAALRCGVQRETMRSNALIHRAGWALMFAGVLWPVLHPVGCDPAYHRTATCKLLTGKLYISAHNWWFSRCALQPSGVGEVNKVVFANPSSEKTFGVPKQSDPEGARDLTMVWQESVANPDDVPGAETAHDHPTC